MAANGLLIFDGDDTLWTLEPLYDRARNWAAQLVAEQGLDPERWDHLQRRLDVANVAIYGFSAERFPTSCVQAYEQMATDAGTRASAEVARAIWDAGSSVFSERAPLLPGIREAIELLGTQYQLALLTRGELDVQQRRVQQSGLGDHFAQVSVVAEKTPDTFLNVCEQLGVSPSDSWSIGNSLVSDLIPALAAGLGAIWIDAYVWEYERAGNEMVKPPEVIEVHDAQGLVRLLNRKDIRDEAAS